MKKIIIVGGGIVGSCAAYFLSQKHEVILIDEEIGQASKNAVGFICPWLSLRRNKKWLNLVTAGAAFYKTLKKALPDLPYYETGTIVFKKDENQLLKIEKNLEKNNITIHHERYQNTYSFIEDNEPAIYTKNGGYVDGEQLVALFKKQLILNKGKIINKKAIFKNQQVFIENQALKYDEIIFACGAKLGETLVDYDVDIYPQKGQLLKLKSNLNTKKIPGMMLNGEIDILPQKDGLITIGATHENDMGFDLSIDKQKCNAMLDFASQKIKKLKDFQIQEYRVGTRAYTSDFLPFFGKIQQNIYVACGLGSSGLTSGPIIAYLLTQCINKEPLLMDITDYSPLNYIKTK